MNKIAKHVPLRPRTATTPISLSRYIDNEMRSITVKGDHYTLEFREWLARQLMKRN